MNQTGAGTLNITINTGAGSSSLTITITGQTGGGATNLDGQVTATMTLGALVPVDTGVGALQWWELVAGTEASALGTYQRGSDYNAVTNARVFVRRS